MEKQIKEEVVKTKDDTKTVYELSILLLPSLAPEQVPAKAAAIKGMLTSAGGAVISDEDPVLIDLAYPMTKVVGTTRHKCDSGYFGWTKFEIEAEGIEAVKKALDAHDEVLRYIIIKTVHENTLLHGKMMLKKEDKVKKEEVMVDDEALATIPEIEKEVVAEDIDKSIDDLVIA